ncbi:MAG: hypothetical protein IJB06_04295 [Bacteroidales bacterium]|nr:hypothetical protein [Bacteroidales bacterium]
MKRILIITVLAVLLPVMTFAQRGILRSNNVSVSSTVVTRIPKAKTYNAKVGFQQMAGLLVSVGGGASYIGGYRFNDYIFAGAGADIFIGDGVFLPIYAHSRFYVSRYNWRPYLAVSAGCDLIHMRGCLDLSLGVDVKVHQKFNMYFGLGGEYISNYAINFLGKLGFSF